MSSVEAKYPHCDENVLHSKAQNCVYCNRYPERQAERERRGINFTGENDPTKSPCPATLRRPVETINLWHGNIPMTPEQQVETSKYYEDLTRELSKISTKGPEFHEYFPPAATDDDATDDTVDNPAQDRLAALEGLVEAGVSSVARSAGIDLDEFRIEYSNEDTQPLLLFSIYKSSGSYLGGWKGSLSEAVGLLAALGKR